MHFGDVCTTGSCQNVLIKQWRKGERTAEGYNGNRTIFINELLCIKKRTSEFFFYAKQRVNKNRSSIFHGVMFLFHTYWDFFLLKATRLLPSTVKYYRSCLRLDERCIFSRSLSMYEINYGTFNVLRIRYRINTFLSINLSKSWIITICYQNDCLPQSSTLNKTIYFFLWKNVSCPCRTFEVLPFWSPNSISSEVVQFPFS